MSHNNPNRRMSSRMLAQAKKRYLYGTAAKICKVAPSARISEHIRYETSDKGWDFMKQWNR